MRKDQKALLISLLICSVLTGTKFVAWYLTGSLTIFSDALESIINVVASALTFWSLRISARPRDLEHPYGHGKIEFFSVGFEGAMIFGAGIMILAKAVGYFFHEHTVEKLDQGIYIVVGSSIINLFLGLYLKKLGKEMDAVTLKGNGQHILTDAWSGFGLSAALVLLHFTNWIWLDPLVSLGMGALIGWNGYQLVRQSFGALMDEANPETLTKLVALFASERKPQWIDFHNFRTQHYGNNLHIDTHITLPKYFELEEVHREVKSLEALVSKSFEGETELFLHVDPCIPTCCPHCSISDCPIRTSPFEQKVEWTLENFRHDKKHSLV